MKNFATALMVGIRGELRDAMTLWMDVMAFDPIIDSCHHQDVETETDRRSGAQTVNSEDGSRAPIKDDSLRMRMDAIIEQVNEASRNLPFLVVTDERKE